MAGRNSLLRLQRPSRTTALRFLFIAMLLVSGVLLLDYSYNVSAGGASGGEAAGVESTASPTTPTAGSAGENATVEEWMNSSMRDGEDSTIDGWVNSNMGDGENANPSEHEDERDGPATDSTSVEAASLTVISEQTGPLKVYNRTGVLVYEYEEYARYWDIDPSPVGERTLLFVATVRASADACDGNNCQTNVVGRLDLPSGEHTRLFERTYSADRGSHQWHDVDRINETHIAVAGIKRDRVFFANTETGEITWQWNASEHYSSDQGRGKFDWTHLNDVEVLEDGRVMASVRNMDEIVFIRPGQGVLDDWTLGEDDNHDIIYEQHNSDYIPPERGGPAVIVADSHNNRIVEYQRVNGAWRQSWEWTDTRAQWTRDGDRLPDGHTLITDTNGGRVLEVDGDGQIVWTVDATKAYEAERLGTGDESATGESIVKLRSPEEWNRATTDGEDGNTSVHSGIDESQFSALQSEGSQSTGPRESSLSIVAWGAFKDTAPPYFLNSLLFVLSPWIDPVQLLPILIAVVAIVLWSACELYWRFEPSLAGRLPGGLGPRGR